jgi:acid stress-induced BolA-like protein IbaG/YrbA
MDKETRDEIEALGAAFFVAVISAIIKGGDTAEQRREIAFAEININAYVQNLLSAVDMLTATHDSNLNTTH